ncbi:hypothetical protein [Marinomonas balearica]|nr:hypothetical protein [Marinomonas balearica]
MSLGKTSFHLEALISAEKLQKTTKKGTYTCLP